MFTTLSVLVCVASFAAAIRVEANRFSGPTRLSLMPASASATRMNMKLR